MTCASSTLWARVEVGVRVDIDGEGEGDNEGDNESDGVVASGGGGGGGGDQRTRSAKGHERLRGAANELKANLLVGGHAVVRCEDAPTHAHVPAVDGAVLRALL